LRLNSAPEDRTLSFSSLLLFVGVYVAAVATPGPGIAALVARVLGRGLGGIAPFIAGFVVGDLIWFSFAATGLAVLAHEFAGIFTAIRFAGVAYLLYLAWTMWRAPAPSADVGAVEGASAARSFLGSLSLTLGNPKVIVSIMPLVVDFDALNARTALEVAATMIVVLSSVLLTYAIAANRARRLFRSSRAMKMINRGAAGVMAGAALTIAAR
jgi:threonine/homoserine/homoserine lactone efflux protein